MSPMTRPKALDSLKKRAADPSAAAAVFEGKENTEIEIYDQSSFCLADSRESSQEHEGKWGTTHRTKKS